MVMGRGRERSMEACDMMNAYLGLVVKSNTVVLDANLSLTLSGE